MPDEDREAAKHHALHLGEQPVAPVQRCLQGLLARRCGAQPQPQQGQALVEQGCGLVEAVSLDAPGGELDRQRHAVELAADADDDGGFRIAKVHASAGRRGALHEQPGGGEALSDRRRDRRIVGRTGKRLQPVGVLPCHLKRLAARCQHVDVGCLAEDARGQSCHRFDQVLAGIEDQETSLVAQVSDQSGGRIVGLDGQPQHGGHGRGHQVAVVQHAQVDEEHGPRESLDQVMADRHRDRRLADPAGTDDRDQACSVQPSRKPENIVVAPDHPDGTGGQVAVGEARRRCRLLGQLARLHDRRHEAVASPGQGLDVACAVLPIAERLAQAGHVEPQAAFFHPDVGPDAGQEIVLADELVRTGQQSNQDVERTRAQLYGLTIPGEKPFARDQAERTERQDVPGLRRPRCDGVVPRSPQPTAGSLRELSALASANRA